MAHGVIPRRLVTGGGVYRARSVTTLLRRQTVSVVSSAATDYQVRTVPVVRLQAGGVYRRGRAVVGVRRMAVKTGVATPPAASSGVGWLLLLGVGA